MSWDYERSKERLAEEWKRIREVGISVEKLAREMDLRNLSPTDARVVHGTHLYAGVCNLGALLDDGLMRRDNFLRLHRYLHVVRVEQRRIVQEVFDGDKIQVQGPKFHGLLYKPYDDDAKLAWSSVLCGIALHLLFDKALPQVFPDYAALVPRIGAELGDSVVANVGVRGDRELISIGNAANYAAKIMDRDNAVTIGQTLFSILPKKRQALFVSDGSVYRLDCQKLEGPEKLVQESGFSWSIESSVKKMQEVNDSLPLAEITIEEARERIDLEQLGPKHAKVCSGVSIFTDIDGFTRLVDSLVGNLDELAKAIQVLHLFRYELRQVTQSDFDGVTIQHQGDRLQALVNVPYDQEGRIKNKATDICISHNSSVEEILNKDHAVLGELHVAIGCDFGKTLVCRSGVRGDLDSTCLGDAAFRAEEIQLQLTGNEIGISKTIYEALTDESIRLAFSYDSNRGVYVSKGLTWTSLEDEERTRDYAVSVKAAYATGGSVVVGPKSEGVGRPLKVTKPWFG